MTSLTKTTSSVAGVNAVSVDGRGLAGHGGENGQDVLVAPDLQPAFLSGQISGTDGDILLGPVIARILQGDPEFRLWGRNPAPLPDAQVDYLFATPRQIHDPQAIFRRLRLGGQFVFAGRRREVRALCDRYMEWGFAIERPPGFVRRSWLLPFLGTKVHHFVARKVHLVAAGQTSERFTYDVQLEQRDCQYVICKRVPSIESVKQRLRKRWGDADEELLENRARKFTEKIFPTFLTRETAILKLLQEKLPAAYARHVPRVLDFEKDIRGYVRTLRMNWLRNGGAPLGQLEFARQSADLLRTIHDVAGIIHLDLRLDNFVVTSDGVGFVDFGSAVRVGEDLKSNPLLASIFDELMKTSQIQRMLAQMTRSGHVTSQALCGGQGKVDKAVDVFYLAVQINAPYGNPDLLGLVDYQPGSPEATALAQFTEGVLKPSNPSNPAVRSAKDMLRELELVQRRLVRSARRRSPKAKQSGSLS